MVENSLFSQLLEVIVNNTHLLYMSYTSSSCKLTLTEFRRELAVQLCHIIVYADSTTTSVTIQYIVWLSLSCSKESDWRICSKCSSEDEGKLANTFCSTWTDKPVLCMCSGMGTTGAVGVGALPWLASFPGCHCVMLRDFQEY